jgi:predicted DNA-binding transcriptional regulator AlpA
MKQPDNTTQQFTVVLASRPTSDQLDRIAESGCSDAAIITTAGVTTAEFERSMSSLTVAIRSAVVQLESVGVLPVRIVDQDLVTIADMANRIGVSRETVNRYVAGRRGPGNFPPPISPGRPGTQFFRWCEVEPWLLESKIITQRMITSRDLILTRETMMLQLRRMQAYISSQIGKPAT